MRVVVYGCGAWGTALAVHLSKLLDDDGLPRHCVSLADCLSPAAAAELSAARENVRYLPGVALPPALSVSGFHAPTISAAHMHVLAVPSAHIRSLAARLAPLAAPGAIFVCASKGLEEGALQLTMTAVLLAELPPALRAGVCALGGPSFAAEVARGLPTAVVVAAAAPAAAAAAAAAFHGGLFRAYTTADVAGVEHGAALKNIFAIACGISDGAALGANARAAIITRGLGEITRIALARGASPLTLLGLAGLGDLVLTCTGDLSRNRRVGLALGAGRALPEVLAELGQCAEGVLAARTGHLLALRLGVDAPLIQHVHGMLYEGKTLAAVLRDIAEGGSKAEWAPPPSGDGGGAAAV